MTLVVILTVRHQALEVFRVFERRAAVVMARYGGAIERSVVVPPESGSELLREIHVVTFPDLQALEGYRADIELRSIAHLRDAAVVKTEILIGEEGPDYLTAD
jgi:uncharacterized protein (DUF1330 family)